MPRSGQIIPEYLHPHVETYINDNTVFQEVVAAAPEGVHILSVFTSGKGRDGVLIPMDNVTDYIEEYGNPNYKLYGQPGYMPYAALYTGQVKAYCMRVMPADAAYSNAVVLIKAKVDVASKTLTLKHVSLFNSAMTDNSDFQNLVDLMGSTDPDADGFTTYPLVGVYALGRGIYGDGLRVRLSSSIAADKENDYKNFNLEVLTTDGGIQTKERFTGTLFADAVVSNTSIFLGDLIADAVNGSNKIGAYVVSDTLDALLALYKQIVPDTTLTADLFDVVTGKLKDGTPIPSLIIDDSAISSVSPDRAEGVALAGGSDGAFAVTNAADSRETAINAAYTKAFQGGYDSAILSKRRAPLELIFDANYAEEVKRALIGLILNRGDAYGFIDGGILNTTTDAISWATSMSSLGDRLYSKECQHYMVRDPFSGKNIKMTITYFLAQQLPVHFKTPGKEVPLVGEKVAKLSGAIKNSLKPVIDADDLDVKEQLYNSRVNYFECTAENVFVRGVQGTSQNVWSDLSEENNMHILLDMKRAIEGLVGTLMYNFAEEEDRQRFTETATRLIEPYIGTKCKTASVSFAMNSWETERSILHCYLAVTFRTMAKRGIIEIDINKRV